LTKSLGTVDPPAEEDAQSSHHRAMAAVALLEGRPADTLPIIAEAKSALAKTLAKLGTRAANEELWLRDLERVAIQLD